MSPTNNSTHDTMRGKRAFTILVDQHGAGMRLDALVASRTADCSRSFSADLIRSGDVSVDGVVKKPGYRVRAGDQICGHIPSPEPVRSEPEPIPLSIIYEDPHLIIVNKPPGLVVHPAPGHRSGTLVNAVLYLCPELRGGEDLRPGIVHRLDKDTSGLLIVTKTAGAREHLMAQFKARTIQKTYLAIVYGKMDSESGVISLPIGRHPRDRKRMSTTSRKLRDAETGWRVRERFTGATFIELDLKTGRTHQIRVHCLAVNHPVVGDPVYGGRKRRVFSDRMALTSRQMLHAWRVRFIHPASEKILSAEAPIPSDMNNLIEHLRGGQS